MNRVGRKISSDHQYDRGRGFGIIDRGVGRGRGGNRGHGGRRGGFDCGSGRGRGYDRDGGDSHNAPTKNFRSLQPIQYIYEHGLQNITPVAFKLLNVLVLNIAEKLLAGR